MSSKVDVLSDVSARLVVETPFERFFRTPQSQTFNDDPGGSGLGLSIAKQIIDKHNGHITVESQLGQGTRFTIHLPLHTATQIAGVLP